MKFYICPVITDQNTGRTHRDRDHFLEILHGCCHGAQWEEVSALEDCELYVALGGMYLTFGYWERMERELVQARSLGKQILVVRPYSTGYVPAGLRPYADRLCSLDGSLKQLIEGV